MKYGKIENNIVVQVQPYQEDGFVQVADNVEAQMEQKSDNTFDYPQSHYDKIQAQQDKLTQSNADKASGNQKLLDLGLTQAEATALTGYTPPVEE
jgi:hypothetical protein